MSTYRMPLPLGTETKWGPIEMIGCLQGERYYWMVKDYVVSMIPAFMVENDQTQKDNIPATWEKV